MTGYVPFGANLSVAKHSRIWDLAKPSRERSRNIQRDICARLDWVGTSQTRSHDHSLHN